MGVVGQEKCYYIITYIVAMPAQTHAASVLRVEHQMGKSLQVSKSHSIAVSGEIQTGYEMDCAKFNQENKQEFATLFKAH